MVAEPQIQMNPNQGQGDFQYTHVPWPIRLAREWKLWQKIKILLIILGVGIGIWVMFKWFSWTFLIGLVTIPAWYFWALRQIDRESYILIECRLKGDEVQEGIFSTDTQTNIWQIPPDLWHQAKKVGNPFTPGSRVYICDRYEEDEETGTRTIYFGDTAELSNLHFYTRLALWLDLKRRLPKLMHDVAMFRFNIDILAQERMTQILEQMGILQQLVESPEGYWTEYGYRKVPVSVKKTEVNDVGKQQIDGNGPRNVGGA